jgi:homopolymeric O-antigen transport system permease protein
LSRDALNNQKHLTEWTQKSVTQSIPNELNKTKQNHSILIEPSQNRTLFGLTELWDYRELLFFMTWRDIKVRYKQSVLGVIWAIFQPLMQMVIFSLIFGRLANLPSDGIPYPIFSYAALVPWTFFAGGLGKATNSLITSSAMIKKIYFPRLVLPISNILSGFIDFFVAFSIIFVLMIVYDVALTWRILLLPFLFLLAFVTSLGVSLWLAPLNAQFRDVRRATAFLIRIWFWITPITYSSSSLPAPFNQLYALNPMAGVVEGFRWALAGADTEPGMMVFISAVMSILLLLSGLLYFRRMESTFADVV